MGTRCRRSPWRGPCGDAASVGRPGGALPCHRTLQAAQGPRQGTGTRPQAVERGVQVADAATDRAAGWAEVVVMLPPPAAEKGSGAPAADLLSAFLFDLGTPGLCEEEGRLVAYFPDDAELPARVAAAAHYAARLLGREPGIAVRPVPAVDWVETWKRQVTATEVAPGIVVAPTWEARAGRPGEVVVRLDPGMAFGTGSHPSTRLCLAALADLAAERRPIGAVLDIGTGSGILAIAAAKLGARRVLAIDTDPVAAGVARANVVQNEVETIVQVETGDVDRVTGEFDLILANILAAPLVSMAPALTARLAPGGAVVLSGLLAEEADGVAAAYEALGLVEARRLREAEWTAVVAVSPLPRPGHAAKLRLAGTPARDGRPHG